MMTSLVIQPMRGEQIYTGPIQNETNEKKNVQKVT
jgi:hypothetical protein